MQDVFYKLPHLKTSAPKAHIILFCWWEWMAKLKKLFWTTCSNNFASKTLTRAPSFYKFLKNDSGTYAQQHTCCQTKFYEHMYNCLANYQKFNVHDYMFWKPTPMSRLSKDVVLKMFSSKCTHVFYLQNKP